MKDQTNVLKEKIDRYCELKTLLNQMSKEADELNSELKQNLKVGVEYFGNKYSIRLIERVSPVLDPKKVYSKLKNRIFDVVTVVKKEAQKYLSEIELDDCIKEFKSSISIEINKIK